MPSPVREGGKPLAVVTRPRDESGPLAVQLTARGLDVLIEPMIEIAPLDAAMPSLAPYEALAFTSVNGVRAFARQSPERRKVAYAVGAGTAAALRTAGFQDIRTGPGDAAALAAIIRSDLSPGARLLHAAGKIVAVDMAALLTPFHIHVDRIALYDAIPASGLSPRLADALYACTVGYVLFFSPRTAQIFGTLIGRAGLTETCRSSMALCLSEAVAAEARALPWARIAAAARPAADALLELLPRQAE